MDETLKEGLGDRRWERLSSKRAGIVGMRDNLPGPSWFGYRDGPAFSCAGV
jgi:hypothetical protein